MENLGVKLVRQAGARTNDIAGDGCTTSIILAQGLIAEGMKVCLCDEYADKKFWFPEKLAGKVYFRNEHSYRNI